MVWRGYRIVLLPRIAVQCGICSVLRSTAVDGMFRVNLVNLIGCRPGSNFWIDVTIYLLTMYANPLSRAKVSGTLGPKDIQY